MKAFVTGGTGFIGRHVIRKLLARGYEVYGLTRRPEGAAWLEKVGARAVIGNVDDRHLMRPAMQGSDVVFHLAGLYSLRGRDQLPSESINVAGTANVLELAYDLGVPKIVYTSTTMVLGDTHGEAVDESYVPDPPTEGEYVRTKWLAHYKVAVPLIKRGAPIIIVMPGAVYGPGDHSWLNEAMRLFLMGVVFLLPGPGFTHTYEHVDDVAEGLILAAEKGRVGETYFLTGPAIPLGEMVDFWSQLTGIRAPIIRIPAGLVRPFAPLTGLLEKAIPLPQVLSADALRRLDSTYITQSAKAQKELGWRQRTLQHGMRDTLALLMAQREEEPVLSDTGRQTAAMVLLAAASLLLISLLNRRRTRATK